MRTGMRNLIVNADDFGAGLGINGGIIHCHVEGVVTSTSLMVTGRAAENAAALAREHPALAVGLHWDLDGEDGRDRVALENSVAVRSELDRQLDAFVTLIGKPPTHVDSHHHVHRRPEIAPIACELVAPLGVPLRADGSVRFVGGFYGQWEWQVTDLTHVSPEHLTWILRNEVDEGWTELGCHPGYVADDFSSVYLAEREVEVATLTDPQTRAEIDALGICLASYADLGEEGAH
ncbi:MAG: ChbG/HpnK family deacetylase [Thermoleophilaceae bacterium]|nr:ChbG/HpnK family deacetylase [Thermoleophilaceae bacterium]